MTDPLTSARVQMVERQIRPRGVHDARVLEAMRTVPRHLFVPENLRHRAYDDNPLPIGHGQTISQPLMVGLVLQALELTGQETVLEIGAGCGYQSALLAELAATVVAVEIVAELAELAQRNLTACGYGAVRVVHGDGGLGFPPLAPYQAIAVAAAAPSVPPPLFEQLAEGGRLVLPVGVGHHHVLERVRKVGGEPRSERLGDCAFVPLVGVHGR